MGPGAYLGSIDGHNFMPTYFRDLYIDPEIAPIAKLIAMSNLIIVTTKYERFSK